MEFDIFLGVAALVIAAVLTWCILRFFFAPRRRGARATLHDGVQQATITVRGGYSPDIVTMQAGIPITLRFDRKETGECTSHVVFPDLGTDTMLPGNETTEMSLPPLPAGMAVPVDAVPSSGFVAESVSPSTRSNPCTMFMPHAKG